MNADEKAVRKAVPNAFVDVRWAQDGGRRRLYVIRDGRESDPLGTGWTREWAWANARAGLPSPSPATQDGEE
jgi:hypothetical protein